MRVRGALATLAAVAVAAVVGLVAAGETGSGGSSDRESTLIGPPVPFPAELQTTPEGFADANGNELLLRGFNLIPVSNDLPGETWGPEHYKRIRGAGFNALRFVLYWRDFEPAPGEFAEGHLATLDRAISHARDAGLYVVLDTITLFRDEELIPAWAHTGDRLRDIETHAHGYLKMLARRYRDEPTVFAYDPVNEPPTSPPDQDRILRMYDSLIRSIRSVDADKIVMIEPSAGDSSMEGANLDLLSDKRNVAFSIHDYYAGGAGDGYQPDGSQDSQLTGGPGRYAWDGHTGYSSGTAEELEQHLLVNLRIMRAAGIPVWVGEFGMNPDAPDAARWVDDKVALFKKHRLGYAWWLYATGGGLHVVGPEGELLPFSQELP